MNLTKRCAALLLALILCLSMLPANVFAANPVLTVTPAPEFTVYAFTGATTDARNGTRITDNTLDLSEPVYFMTGNNVQMSGLCLWPVEGDELPSATICNSAYNGKIYSDDLLVLKSVSSSSLMAGTILGSDVGYDWDLGQFYAREGLRLQYMAAGDYYPEPGRYRFLMFYSNYCYYSEVYTITDNTDLTADQGVLEAAWLANGNVTKVVPYDVDAAQAAFDLSLSLPAEVPGIHSVRLLKADYDIFGSDSYYWFGYNSPEGAFQVGEQVDEGVRDGRHVFTLKGCTIANMSAGCYRVKVIGGNNKHYIDNTVTVVREVSNDPPVITTASLPDGKADVPYYARLDATPVQDGTITWSVSSGRLPDGLTLDAATGEISGTPTNDGSFTFYVKASEAGAGYAEKEYTIAVAQADLAMDGEGSFWYDSAEELIQYGSSCIVSMYFNRAPSAEDSASATVYYTTTANAKKTLELALPTYGWGGASAGFDLPADAKRIDRIEYVLNGEKVNTKTVNRTVAPALELAVTGTSSYYLYLSICDDTGKSVYSRNIGWQGQTLTLKSLPSGTYRAVLGGTVTGFGHQIFGETEFTLQDGTLLQKTLPIVPHGTTYVSVNAQVEGQSWCSARIDWYADAAGTQKVQEGGTRTLLDDEAYWVRAVPLYDTSIMNLPSELIRVDRGDSTTGSRVITVSLRKKPTATANVTALCEQLDGSAPKPGYYMVSVTKYGTSGNATSRSFYPNWRTGEAVALSELTEGSRITLSGDTGWGSVQYVVTAADIAKGSIDLSYTIPLADGMIRWSAAYTDSTGTHPYPYVNNLRLQKADGTVLSFVRRNEFLMLTEPEAVSFGETLTLTGWNGDEQFPDCVGSAQFVVANDAGRRSGAVLLPIAQRPYLSMDVSRGLELPDVTLLLYGADGSLLWQRRDADGGSIATRIYLYTPRIAPGAYFVGIAPTAFLDGISPEDYDTASELAALTYAKLQAAVTDSFDRTHLGAFELPEGFRVAQMVNLALSGVSMGLAQDECFRMDVTVTPKPGFAWNGSLELYILTNQPQSSTGLGYISTRALSVNGIPLEINRFDQNGVIQSDGSITLRLTPEKVEELGGFPLKLSTTCMVYDVTSLEAKAYLRYYTATGYHSDYVGECSEPTDRLTLTVPNMVTDGSFTVYGRGPASVQGDPYNVTLYLNGEPIASGATDTQRGYFRIPVRVSENRLQPLQTLRFTVSGAFAGGVRAYSSAQQQTLYNPEGAQLQTLHINWEPHQGDFEAGRGQSMIMLNDGDAPRIYSAWYRGGHAEDLGKVFWSVTFAGHPEKVQGARVFVPRNGTTQTLECVKQPDGSWATEPTFFFGAAPDGAWVEFDCPVEYGYVPDPDSAFNEDNVTQFLRLLSGSTAAEETSGSPLGDGMLSFLLSDSEGNQLPVGFSLKTYPWDESEVQALRELQLDPHTPNLLDHTDDWMTFGEGDDAFTVWASDTITRYVNHDDNSKHFYEEQIYTPDFRMIRTFDEATKTKQVSILSIGALNFRDMNLGSDFADEGAHGIARSAELQRIWMIFYQQFADAMVQTIEAQDPNAQEPTRRLITDACFLPAEAKRGPSTQEIQEAINKLRQQKEKIEQKLDDPFTKIVQDSYNWAHGEEITQKQIRRVKDFLDDNPCLKRLYRFWRSGTNEANNPYRVIAEADSVYFKVGVEGIAKILEEAVNSTSYLEGSAKDAAKKLGDAIYKGSVERAYDGWKQALYDADIFDRQIENLCQDLYIAARRAEREERGIGGLCNEGIKWNRFPTEYYDYNKYFGYGPRSYSHVTPPPGPQGRYDPSGYIYEAVPSNRVEGAEVTLWQLGGDIRTTVDETGVAATLSGGTPIVVDAELFGIEPNPQITGEDGRYQWFVPSGWWRVKVTKNGYESADTGTSTAYGVNALKNDTDGFCYMPVLPEQLDVNIPLVSYEAPIVDRFVANTLGVFVSFSKYMDETSLTPDRFTLVVNGKVAETTLELCDSEKSSAASDAPSYTSMVRMTYPGIAEGDNVRIIIDNRVSSYAGVCMERRFDMSDLTVRAPAQTPAPTASVPAGEVAENTAVVLRCTADDAVIRYTLDGTEPTEDSPILRDAIVISEDTMIKTYASRPDRTDSEIVTFSYTLPAPQTAVARVVASMDGTRLQDGDTVKPGKLTLTCDTEGAEIWYTTNGVCPCDDETARHQYTEPIDLTPGTYYFRIRALKDGVYSDGLPLHLTVRGENPFEDVIEGKFYYDAVLWAVAHDPQITTGTDETHFKPGNTCTRAQIVAFLWRAKGCPAPKNRNNPFTDVKDSAYYFDAVLWAVENGVTTGTSATKFAPKKDCTRAQVVTFLWRAEGEPSVRGSSEPFEDVKKDAYYYDAVLWAVENDITTGTGKGRFSPSRACTRGQIVSFLYRDFTR